MASGRTSRISAAPAFARPAAARLARAHGDEARLERRHHGDPFGFAHSAPAGDLVERAAAADAKRRHRVDDADLDAGGGDRRGGHGRHLGGRPPDEKAAPGGDFGRLLRRARHVAGLAADLAARERRHGGRPDRRADEAGERMAEAGRERARGRARSPGPRPRRRRSFAALAFPRPRPRRRRAPDRAGRGARARRPARPRRPASARPPPRQTRAGEPPTGRRPGGRATGQGRRRRRRRCGCRA